ncbi:MAG TPA: substrate-binding domain-containing protein, partial [Panacibacter sp.]|nr:substrate-binding domain-containing protein [Panacibacter sp.]
ERENQIIHTMKKHRVDGLLISISKHTTAYGHFEMLQKSGIPLVFFDCIPNMTDIHYVACNMVSGTVQAISYLLKKGHRVIGLINGPEKLIASKQRQEGYQIAMSKHRLKYDPSLVVNSELSKESTCSVTKQLLSHKRKVTAIVTFNDYVAIDAMQYADEQKVKINKDVCFVSYANLPLVQHLKFSPMASVEQYPYLQGQKAAEMLIELLGKKDDEKEIHGSYKIIVDSQLVVYSQ